MVFLTVITDYPKRRVNKLLGPKTVKLLKADFLKIMLSFRLVTSWCKKNPNCIYIQSFERFFFLGHIYKDSFYQHLAAETWMRLQ